MAQHQTQMAAAAASDESDAEDEVAAAAVDGASDHEQETGVAQFMFNAVRGFLGCCGPDGRFNRRRSRPTEQNPLQNPHPRRDPLQPVTRKARDAAAARADHLPWDSLDGASTTTHHEHGCCLQRFL